MLARGLSVRDIEDAFKDESGRLLLSRTAVSQLGERLWDDYQSFAKRDLSEYEISYLFVDGIAERLRPGARLEPVLAAWGSPSVGFSPCLERTNSSKPMLVSSASMCRAIVGCVRPSDRAAADKDPSRRTVRKLR